MVRAISRRLEGRYLMCLAMDCDEGGDVMAKGEESSLWSSAKSADPCRPRP